MLNELDKELEHRGHPFVRYVDNCLIFCKSKRATQRTKESVIRYIEKDLYLRVNNEKAHVGYVRGMKFFGYSFYIQSGECCLSVHANSYSKLENRPKELIGCSNGVWVMKIGRTLYASL